MQTSWSHGQATPNKVDNNPKNWKSSLIESWPKGNLIPKNQRYWKKIWPRDNLVYKNPKYANDVTKPVNFR